MAKKSRDLSLKEEIFCREFIAHPNGTKAAVAAGYAGKSAAVTASKLLRKPKIAAEIAKLREKLLAKHEITIEKVLQALADVAFYDPRKFFEQGVLIRGDGTKEFTERLKLVSELDDVTVKALKGCDVEKLFKHFGKGQAEESGTITKIRFADRLEALELLGRHLKLFTDKIEVSDAAGIVQALKEGRERVARG